MVHQSHVCGVENALRKLEEVEVHVYHCGGGGVDDDDVDDVDYVDDVADVEQDMFVRMAM